MLARGIYGVEYNPRQRDGDPSGKLQIVLLIIAVVLVLRIGGCVISSCLSSSGESDLAAETVQSPVASRSEATNAAAPVSVSLPPRIDSAPVANSDGRPPRVKALMARLEKAIRDRNVDLAEDAIKQLRACPQAADLDDWLARRLGELNIRRLFDPKRNRQWVTQVEVRRGDSASRIAYEHGSTMEMMRRLNGGNVDKVIAGRKLNVMDQPGSTLVVHLGTGIADLSIRGKFFRRYDFTVVGTARVGAHQLTSPTKAFWSSVGLKFKTDDRTELEMLMPLKSSVVISEM